MAYDLESLRLIWWVVLGLAMTGLALSEGLSIGPAKLLAI